MPGPRPLPSALKVMRGTDQPCRMNPDEPKPKTDKVSMPTGLSPVARREWRKISKELKAAGLLTNLDVATLRLYCEAYATWLDAQEKIQQYGAVIKNERGHPTISPYFRVADKSFQQVRSILIEFGMSPSARTRVASAKSDDPPDDPFAKLARVR